MRASSQHTFSVRKHNPIIRNPNSPQKVRNLVPSIQLPVHEQSPKQETPILARHSSASPLHNTLSGVPQREARNPATTPNGTPKLPNTQQRFSRKPQPDAARPIARPPSQQRQRTKTSSHITRKIEASFPRAITKPLAKKKQPNTPEKYKQSSAFSQNYTSTLATRQAALAELKRQQKAEG